MTVHLGAPEFADSAIRFKELTGSVNLIAVMIDRDSHITYCNDYFLRLTGWSYADIAGKSWREVFVPPHIADLTGLFADLFEDLPSARHHENDVQTRDGRRRSIRWNNILLRDARGVAVGAASIGEDITDRKKLERELLDSGARERRRLQSDLHDGLGQELFGISLLARSLATVAERQGLESAAQLSTLANIASRAIDTCRRIAHGVSPLSDIHGGLIYALQQLTVTPGGWPGPQVKFRLQEHAPLDLSGDAQDHLYRLAQEAFTNALKHAEADTIEIHFEIQPTHISLQVIDDGIGLPPEVEPANGMGLKMMHYRAGLLHATLRIEGSRRGTHVSVRCRQSV